MPKMSMMIMASLSNNRQLYKTSGLMIKYVVISGMNCRIGVGVESIVFVRIIV